MCRLLRIVAAVQVLLVIPSALFLSAALVGLGEPPQYDLANLAHRVVGWYVARSWSLPLLLIGLPLVVVLTGMATLRRSWQGEPGRVGPQALAMIPAPCATLVVASTTLISVAILGVVGLHVLAN